MRARHRLIPQLAGFLLLLLSLARAAAAQCAGDAILDPQSAGANGQTRLQNYYTLVDDLYSNPNVTRRLSVNGTWLQVPPWYVQSSLCGEGDLHSHGAFTSPTFTRYLVNGDELSELAVVTSLANNEQRMTEIHNTVAAMIAGGVHAGLPCWLAKVENGAFSCVETDSASDITARFGLAYAFAAQNPSFSAAGRAAFRDAAAALVEAHLDGEYVRFDPQVEACPQIAPTGRPICDWAAGGGTTAARGSFQTSSTHMLIGYFQDTARFLIAVAESESARNPALAARALAVADEVVEEWLDASRFDGSHATFGDEEFVWDLTVSPIAPRALTAWGYNDASRALWMGDVLRAIRLHTRGAALSGTYARLSSWVQLLLAGTTQQPSCSVVQYSADGQPVSTCVDGFFENGLGAGLFTFQSIGLLDDKVDAALHHYTWGTRVWDNPSVCFGIYNPARPIKALASAIGLDAAAYGTTCPPPVAHLLAVQRGGAGSGSVASSPAGVDCGATCSASYASDASVALTANPAAGSTFVGWSGDCTGTGACSVTMNADRSVTATFAPACTTPTAPTWLRVSTISDGRLDLLWQDNSSTEQGFKVERKQGCCGPWTPLSPTLANATTYQSTGLQCGTTYAYRVWAYSGACESAKTNEAAAATSACSAPAAPTWLRVSAASSARIDLLWQDNSTNESGFKVERKQGCCGPWMLLTTTAANATTYQSTGLTCGTTYAYRVWATNGTGDSSKTNEAGTATLSCP